MLTINKEINIAVEKSVSTIVGVAVVSKYNTSKTITVKPSCGCTTSINSFTIQPNETYVNQLTIKRVSEGYVTISYLVSGGDTYVTKINITLK